MSALTPESETPPIIGGDSLLTQLMQQRATGVLKDLPESTFAIMLTEALKNQQVLNATHCVPYAELLKKQKMVPIQVSDHICAWVDYYHDGSKPVIVKAIGFVMTCASNGGSVKVFLKPGLNTVPQTVAIAYKLYEDSYMEQSALDHYVRTVNDVRYNQFVLGENGIDAPNLRAQKR